MPPLKAEPMSIDLEPIKAILRAFLNDIQKVQHLRQSVSAPQMATALAIDNQHPIFDNTQCTLAPDSCWEKEDAYTLLSADAWKFRSYMHRPKPPAIPEYYQQPALPVYQLWRQENRELFNRKCAQIPVPSKDTSLAHYVQLLSIAISEGNEHRDIWIESLRSFLQFLRDDMQLDQKGFLETLITKRKVKE